MERNRILVESRQTTSQDQESRSDEMLSAQDVATGNQQPSAMTSATMTANNISDNVATSAAMEDSEVVQRPSSAIISCTDKKPDFPAIQPATASVCIRKDQPGVSLSPLPPLPVSPPLPFSPSVEEIAVNSHGMPTAAKHLFLRAKVIVGVLNIVSPSHFWVHLLSGSTDLGKLPELEASMKEHYEKQSSQKRFSVADRQLYVVKDDSTGKWWRVHVLNVEKSSAEAFFLDLGFLCRAVPLARLLPLEDQFCSLPFQAVHCSLAGIRPKAGSNAWNEGTVNYFEHLISQLTNAEHLEAAVCQVDGSGVHLELMLPCGETVNNLLVMHDMAEYLPHLKPEFFVLSRHNDVDVHDDVDDDGDDDNSDDGVTVSDGRTSRSHFITGW